MENTAQMLEQTQFYDRVMSGRDVKSLYLVVFVIYFQMLLYDAIMGAANQAQ